MTVRAPRRRRTSLAGSWEYEPLARTTISAGRIVEETNDLPAPGGAPVPSNWHDHGLAGFDGRVRYATRFEYGAAEPRTFL
ncbi:MAG: hypothetical protein L0206_21855, partial [Actinobacteria bacterium]|nr:hypothetical protein [Actinomycetota bacterium]